MARVVALLTKIVHESFSCFFKLHQSLKFCETIFGFKLQWGTKLKVSPVDHIIKLSYLCLRVILHFSLE